MKNLMMMEDSRHQEKGYGYGVLCHFQQYFSYSMAVSFIGGGNHRPVTSHDKLYYLN
jgi:hypothetical protein